MKKTSRIKIKQLVVRYKWFLLIVITGLILCSGIRDSDWTREGLKMIPPTIGVLLGGLLSTTAIIFSLLKEEELSELYKKYGEKLISPFRLIKLHILLMLASMVVSLFSFFLIIPPWISSFFHNKINPTLVFYFIQVLCILITVASAIEVIMVLFIIFEVKLTLLAKKK